MNDAALLDVHSLRQSFPRADGGEHLVLDGVELSLAQGQIVGLLGRTGSGKSTLLRLIAGLAQPSGGTVTYLGERVTGPAPGIAMVFQSFALFPWLTVLENVQLGLEALGLPEAELLLVVRNDGKQHSSRGQASFSLVFIEPAVSDEQ